MKILKTSMTLLASSLLLVGLSGCVDQEPSMSLRGSVLFEGSVDDNGQVTCDITSAQPGSVQNWNSRANVDLGELENAGVGYLFWADVTNLLEQSTQVGSGGGGGDNFQGLREDQNYIMVTGATVRFPADLNQFAGAKFAQSLEKKELFSSVIDSGGGGAILSVPIIGPRQVSDFQDFYRDALTASNIDPAANADSIIPLVAEIQIEGETFSGRQVESNKFQFPINLCLDCPPPSEDEPDPFQTTGYCLVKQ